MMNVEEAKNILKRNDINPLLYSFGSPMQTQCYVIEKENGIWCTYHWERGRQHFKILHSNEENAVADFIENVVRSASLNERRKIVLK